MGSYARHLNNIPVNPSIAAKILAMAERQDFSFRAVEEVIRPDPGLTAKILRIANSALYAQMNKVTRLQNAITLLGMNTIKNLVILVTGSSLLARHVKSPFYSLFWRHSLATAFLSRDLAARTGNEPLGEEAFVAGLLHNIGQAAFYLEDPAGYEALLERARRDGRRVGELETETFGTNHKEVGSEVLRGWNFPAVYSDSALEHGNENVTSEHKQVVLLVTIADFIASNWFFLEDSPIPCSLLEPHLGYFGMDQGEVEAWQAECRGRMEADPFYRECQNLITG